MATKAQLEERIEQIENDNRRLERALNQVQLDLKSLDSNEQQYSTPNSSIHANEAIKRGLEEWSRVVVDPSERINAYIKSVEGIGWTWEKDYVKNGQFAWCGAFAAFCYTKARFNIRNKIFPSCYRLYSNWSNTSRKVKVEEVQPGDIVVVYTAKRSVQGDHITLCHSVDLKNRMIHTIEGNAKGTLGDESYGEGVIKQERSFDQVAHVYRLLGADFDE